LRSNFQWYLGKRFDITIKIPGVDTIIGNFPGVK
jgi:hypothetical protein